MYEPGEMRNDEIQHTVLIKERKHHQLHADTIQHAVTLKVLTTQLALCDGVESERNIIESERSAGFSGTRLLSSVSSLTSLTSVTYRHFTLHSHNSLSVLQAGRRAFRQFAQTVPVHCLNSTTAPLHLHRAVTVCTTTVCY